MISIIVYLSLSFEEKKSERERESEKKKEMGPQKILEVGSIKERESVMQLSEVSE